MTHRVVRHSRQSACHSCKPLAVVSALACAGIVSPVHAIDLVWFGGNGDWVTASNWLPIGPPGITDRAVIGVGSASLSFATTIGEFWMTGGQLDGNGTLMVTGLVTLAGGDQTGSGTSQFNGPVSITGNGSRSLNGGRVMNTAGTTTWAGNTGSGGNQIVMDSSATINNSGAWLDQNGFNSSLAQGNSGAKVFNNTGSYTKSGNATTDIYTAFNNIGSVSVQAGRLNLIGNVDSTSTGSFAVASGTVLSFGNGNSSGLATLEGVTFSGTGQLLIDANGNSGSDVRTVGTLSHAGQLAIASGTLQNDAAFKVASYNQTGGQLDGNGTLMVTGLVTLAGGDQTGSGTSQFNGPVSITGNGSRSLNGGRVMNTAGTTTWAGNTGSGGNQIVMDSSATINNSGAWLDQNGFNSSLAQGNSGAKVFNNTGSYTKSGNATTDIYTAFNNIGSVSVQAGRLNLIGNVDSTSTGSFAVASGTVLSFGNGNSSGLATLEGVTFSGTGQLLIDANGNSGSDVRTVGTLSHAGQLAIASGTLQNDAAFKVASYNQTGGQLDGNGTLMVTGLVTLAGGDQTGSGTSQFNGPVSITGNGSRSLNGGRVMNTAGTTTWAGNTGSGGNQIVMDSSATINNSGAWLDQNGFNSSLAQGNSGAKVFNNTGSYTKSGNATTDIYTAFNNGGRIDVQHGVLRVNAPMTNAPSGTVNVSADARLEVTETNFSNAGTLAGNGTIRPTSAETLNNTGIISPGDSIGHLTIDGNLKSSGAASMKFELSNVASFDVLSVTGKATLGGDIGVWDLGYTPVIGDSFVVMTFDQRLNDSTFASLTVHDFGTGTHFDVIYHDHDVTLSVTAVPEPQTYFLMLAGLGCIGWSVRHRQAG